MRLGMLWFDNDPKTALAEKVERASDYYRNKYGRVPDLCLVNPAMFDGTVTTSGEMVIGKVRLRAMRTILPNHLWIGLDDSNIFPVGV